MMNRNSNSRQYNTTSYRFPGYLAPQHQQAQYLNNPPLEGPARYQQGASFNGRSVVQTQGQPANLNPAPVPGAPAARFEGQLPFHNTQGNHQAWIGPHMMPQHGMVQQGGPHGMPQPRQYMYAQTGQPTNAHYGYPIQSFPMTPLQRQPPAPPQTTSYSSNMQQYAGHHTVPLQAQPHVQSHMAATQLQAQRPVMNPMANPQMIASSQGTPNQAYGNTMPTINPSLINHPTPQGTAPQVQKRVPRPLTIVDPKTGRQVDLKEAGSSAQSEGATASGTGTNAATSGATAAPGPSSSIVFAASSTSASVASASTNARHSIDDGRSVSVEADNVEIKDSGTVSLNASATVFIPQKETEQGPHNASDDTTVDKDDINPPDQDGDKEAKQEETPQPAVTDSADIKRSPTPRGEDDGQSSEGQRSAADETVSEKAVASEPQMTEVTQVRDESTACAESKDEDSKPADDVTEETANGDATGEPSENDAPSQDEDVASDSSSPHTYNFRADSTEAPTTTEMRKLHYDRNYLINLQRCKAALKQPSGLPEELIEQGVILKTANPLDLSKPLPALKSKGMDDFTPDYARQYQSSRQGGRYSRDSQGRPGQGSGGSRYSNASSGQRRGSQQASRRIEPVHRQPVKIHQSENAYVPAILQRFRGTPRATTNEDDSEEAKAQTERNKRLRVCFSQLNKLTPQNSEVIFDHIKESGILCDANGIDDIAGAIFKKAITEPPYSVALADLVANIMAEYESDDMSKHRTFFKQHLLSRCQSMFETDLDVQVQEEEVKMKEKMENEKDPKIKAMLGEEIEEAKLKVRLKYYGNIKFVGELYLRGLVGAKTIHDCVAMLLQHKNEESIESVCKFLETTGQKLDQGQATARVDHYFQRIEKIKEKIDSQRLKYKLEDLIDMRARGWQQRERAALYQVKPMTRAELEKERIEEEQKKQIAVDKMVARKREENRYRSGYGGRPSGGGPIGSLMGSNSRRSMPDQPNQSMPSNPDGWKTVAARRVDPRSLTIKSAESNDSDFKLGPTNNISKWSQGCRTKARDGGDRVAATKSFGRQGLSPSPRNSANSSRRGSNSNIPAAVAAPNASTTASTGSGRDATHSRADNDQSRNGATEGATSTSPAEPRQVDSKMRSSIENKTQHIFSEYSAHREFDADAFEPIKMYGDVFVESLVQHVIEKSKVGRVDAGNMIAMMIQKEYLRPEDVAEGLKPHFEVAADILMDVPKFYQYISEFLSGCLCPEIMSQLPNIMAPLDRQPEVATMVCEMLHLASEENGHDKVGLMFRTAQLEWHMFLSKDVKMDTFIQQNKLEFTLTGGVPKVPDSSLSIDDIEKHLKELVCDSKKLCIEDVFSLIETVDRRTLNSHEFISAVVRTIASVCITNFDIDLLHSCCPVLKFVIGDVEKMLVALYAIQQITPKTNDPARINAVFEVLSDFKVINDEAYMAYYDLTTPEITEGYELTLRATANFYATLMNT